MQKNIDQVLQENSSAVKRLFRRNHVIGGLNMDTIKKGFEKHGEKFMMDLLEIITPTEASFSGLIEPKSAILVNTPIDTKTLAVSKVNATAEPAETGKFWSFWDKLLNGVSSTGTAINEFKQNLAASPSEPAITPQQQAQQANNSRMLYMVAAGFVLLIILILIIRK